VIITTAITLILIIAGGILPASAILTIKGGRTPTAATRPLDSVRPGMVPLPSTTLPERAILFLAKGISCFTFQSVFRVYPFSCWLLLVAPCANEDGHWFIYTMLLNFVTIALKKRNSVGFSPFLSSLIARILATESATLYIQTFK
jgi:hypothetical protein